MASQHECVDCAALPVDDRPNRPRPATRGGPKSRRCETHWRARRKASQAPARSARVARTFNLSQDEHDSIWGFQGERCICGRKPSRSPDIDHDHSCCPGRESCGKCIRGLLCRACNTYVIGRYSAAQLRALADYLDNPPAQRLRRVMAARLEEAS